MDGDGTRSDRTTGRQTDPSIAAATEVVDDVVRSIESVVVGKRSVVEHVLATILGRGHLLVEDVPGVGKTVLARAVAGAFDAEFSRVQFTPDLLPADVTGSTIYNRQTESFEFRPGPIFGTVVLADEINRAPPKTQSALLEVMEEGQVTVDGESHPLPDPFVVIATQNTVDGDQTYDLPFAERDRFLERLRMGYADAEGEREILRRTVSDHPVESIDPVASREDLLAARRAAASVTIREPLRRYVVDLGRTIRTDAAVGVSTRGLVHLLRAAQGRAIVEGRGYAIPDDVKREAHAVLDHRVEPAAGRGPETDAEAVVQAALEDVSPP